MHVGVQGTSSPPLNSTKDQLIFLLMNSCTSLQYVIFIMTFASDTKVKLTYCHSVSNYSGTFDSGLSEIGTVYNKPLYKRHCLRSQIFTLPIVFNFQPLRRGQPLYKGQNKQVNLYCTQCVPCLEVPLYIMVHSGLSSTT